MIGTLLFFRYVSNHKFTGLFLNYDKFVKLSL